MATSDSRTNAGALRSEGCDALDTGVDAVEEAGFLRFLMCSVEVRTVAVVGGVECAGGCGADAGAYLRALQAKAYAGELDVTARGSFFVGEEGVGGAFVDYDVGGGCGGGDFSGDVVGEACGGVLAGGVVEEAFVRDGLHGDAGVDLERLPGEDAFGGELGEDFGVAGGVEDFLGDFAGDLVLAVAVGDAADPRRWR